MNKALCSATAIMCLAMISLAGDAIDSKSDYVAAVDLRSATTSFPLLPSMAFKYYSPNAAMYGSAMGFELQARYWLKSHKNIGVLGSIGIDEWEITGPQLPYRNRGRGEPWGLVTGDATYFPIGGSVVWQPYATDKGRVTIEGGARYVMSQVDAEASNWSVSVGNQVIGVLGANYEYSVSKLLNVFCGVGYQFDILKGAFNIDRMGDNEMGGLFIRAGIGF